MDPLCVWRFSQKTPLVFLLYLHFFSPHFNIKSVFSNRFIWIRRIKPWDETASVVRGESSYWNKACLCHVSKTSDAFIHSQHKLLYFMQSCCEMLCCVFECVKHSSQTAGGFNTEMTALEQRYAGSFQTLDSHHMWMIQQHCVRCVRCIYPLRTDEKLMDDAASRTSTCTDHRHLRILQQTAHEPERHTHTEWLSFAKHTLTHKHMHAHTYTHSIVCVFLRAAPGLVLMRPLCLSWPARCDSAVAPGN